MIGNKIAIGTVQFGLDYGVANHSGQVSIDEVKSIINLATQNDITTLDTAIAYGSSESILGQAGVNDFQVITKLPEVSIDAIGNLKIWCLLEVTESLKRLGVKQLDGVLLHRPLQLLKDYGDDLYQSLEALKQSGLVKKIGVSVYEPSDLEKLNGKYRFDLVQLPFNVLDNRWYYWLNELEHKGVEIHVRSIFLQGLLLMPTDQRPNKFGRWFSLLKSWDNWLELNKITPVETCLRYALSFPQISKVIVGVDSKDQLVEILNASVGVLPKVTQEIQTSDVNLLSPANWEKL